ncbi:TIGR03619 family F420-dependent LLM class oxidoreductase [Mycobacterium sp. 852002-51961_SCH5331710]|uniref:TIGR03619 family F420-dependent LLM class oxidoreductase n=1 Tax=Mycobacterium sp. 852002-51961_SCH5331710 TaxID=1834105 RepID=UPI0007FDE720|nr:TIGR03619 family F420-dependent LLM class oxidoreductase [Mycobacterium sp. 852002-51961_SCH5331710]OBB46573.1 LLM class F420-dependent oxidoreductase [Mycobacterium sp. 852002-51961_SCH5331710]
MLGFAVPQFGESARADLARYAATAENLGADSLWVGDRLLTPVNPSVGYAGQDTIPEQFRAALDPFIALAVAATATTRVRLGSSVFVAPWYPPVQLGRQLTAIDVVSGGRLVPGFGIGWSPEEFSAAGAPFRGRGAQLDELLDALEELWTTNPVQHDGKRWSIPSSWVDLKPVQRPRPPIYLAAFTPASLRRIGQRADGWLPAVQVPGGVAPEMLALLRRTIDDAAREAGRDPSAIHTYVRINVAAGTAIDAVAEAVRTLADAGYPDAFVDLMYVATDTDDHLRWVEELLTA